MSTAQPAELGTEALARLAPLAHTVVDAALEASLRDVVRRFTDREVHELTRDVERPTKRRQR